MKSRGRFDANRWSKHLRDLRDERCKDKRMWNIENLYLHGNYGKISGMLVNLNPTHQDVKEYFCGVYKTNEGYDEVGKDIENTTTSFKGFRLEYDQPPVESNKWFKQMFNSMFSKGDK